MSNAFERARAKDSKFYGNFYKNSVKFTIYSTFTFDYTPCNFEILLLITITLRYTTHNLSDRLYATQSIPEFKVLVSFLR